MCSAREPRVFIIGQKYQTNLTAQATQTLFDKSLLLGIKANKPNQQLAALNNRQTQEDVIYNIASNYYQVLWPNSKSVSRDNLGADTAGAEHPETTARQRRHSAGRFHPHGG